MSKFHVDGSNDMTALDLSTISDGTVTTNTSSKLVITATDGTVYTLFGSFSGGEGQTLPTGGNITKWVAQGAETNEVTISGINLSVSDFNHFLQTDNGVGLETTIFAGDDAFNLENGNGNNNVFGSAGNDRFDFGSTFAATDTVDGGGGVNTVALNGNYESLVLNDSTMTNIDRLTLSGDNIYDITTSDGNVAADRTLVVDAKSVGSGGSLTFDGTAETNGRFDFFLGGAAGLTVSGGAGNDIFHGGGTGATLIGAGGNDTFAFGGNFDGTDTINGGAGYNVVDLNGDYSAGLTFGANSLQNIDKIVLRPGHEYDLTLAAANNTVGDTLKIDGHILQNFNTMTIDGSLATGTLILDGGTADDTLTGGSGANNIKGGNGVDTLTGGTGVDRFIYTAATESTGTHHDTVIGFDANADSFVTHFAVTGVDAAVATGALNDATFNGNLAHDLGAGQLAAHHAVLFTASSGDEAGVTFLVIDQNGVAGYQGNQDLVIQLSGATHLGSLSTADFSQGN